MSHPLFGQAATGDESCESAQLLRAGHDLAKCCFESVAPAVELAQEVASAGAEHPGVLSRAEGLLYR